MKQIAFLLVFLVSLSGYAQNLNLNQQLPTNKTIKKGVLKNGLTYYIYPTDVTKNAASYYIIQNVGSVLENNKQQGLAHFLEHMAFNGTENFPGKGVLNTLQKEGAIFGQDINAYTSFDETVYNMNNIPTKPELIDTCLLILRDWADGLLLTDAEIDAERGVIKEEWRTRQSGGMRILKQSLPVKYNNAIYAQRLPIGLMDIVENFDYKLLRDFYHDWYRTDLQSIAVVGDVNVAEIEAKIETLFSNIKAVENPKQRFVVDIPKNDAMQYVMLLDKEVTAAQMEFGIRHARPKTYSTVLDLKNSLIENMITAMFGARISEISRKPDAPFLAAGINYNDQSRTANTFSASIYPKVNQQENAFKVVLEEINRAVKFGFTQEEMDRTIIQFKNYFQTQISKEDDKSHAAIVYEIQQNYLENIAMVDVAEQFKLIETIFSKLSKEEIHNRLKQLYTKENRYLVVTGVEGNENLTEALAVNIIKIVENDKNLKAYEDGFSGKTLISGINIKPGSILSEVKNDELQSSTFLLNNGIKVHYKFADKNKNDIKLQAVSYGGLSLVDDDDLPSAKYASAVVQQSGLGDYSVTDLAKILAGKTASVSVDVSSLTESVNGSSVTKDVETMLQMVYLSFVKPRFDLDAYQVFKGQVDNFIIRRSEDVNQKIQDSVTVTLYGKNTPKKSIFNTEFANKINFEKIKNIYLERFKDASDFEFFIVGDIDKETLKPLLETYIASIPTEKITENWKDNSVDWLSDTIDKDVFLKMEDPKCSVKMSFKNDFEYSIKNNLLAKALGDILDLRYTETLREDEGGTYGASAYANVSKRPTEQANLLIQFECNPDKVENLITIVYNELKKIAAGTISQEDLDKTKTNYLKENKQKQDYNSYDMQQLSTFYREGYNINKAENFEDIVQSITVESIQDFTQKLMKNAKTYEIVIKPLK